MALKITQTRSLIGASARQRRTMTALGLRRIHQSVIRQDSAVVRGMVRCVSHLVSVEAAPQSEEQ